MKKLLIAFVIATSGTVYAQDKAATPQPVDSKNMPEFKFDVEEYNYGTIEQGKSVTYEFKFTNIGKEPLVISGAQGSCGCTVPEYPKEPLKKGEKHSIKVTFNSTGKSGMQDKTVTIKSNAKGGDKVLHIKGNVEIAPVKSDVAPTEQSK